MLGNCLGWVLYALMKQDAWIFVGNAPGFILSIWLNLGATKLIYHEHYSNEIRKSNDNKGKQSELSSPEETLQDSLQITTTTTTRDGPTQHHEHLVMVMVFIWTCIVSIISFASNSLSQDTQQIIVGSTVNIILVFFYGAPLSTIVRILKERNTASIHIPTMITNTANGSFWMVYGFAVNDYFVYAPNGLGVVLGVIQILLCLILPRRSKTKQQDETEQEAIGQKIIIDDGSIHTA